MAAININHTEGSITIDNDKVLQITKNGAIKIGNGSYLDEIDVSLEELKEKYEGVIRYNSDTKLLEYCDGESWKTFAYGVEKTTGIIWSLTF